MKAVERKQKAQKAPQLALRLNRLYFPRLRPHKFSLLPPYLPVSAPRIPQELTNNLTLLPLVMLVLLTAKFTGDIFNKVNDWN